MNHRRQDTLIICNYRVYYRINHLEKCLDTSFFIQYLVHTHSNTELKPRKDESFSELFEFMITKHPKDQISEERSMNRPAKIKHYLYLNLEPMIVRYWRVRKFPE